jgi:hypothetical protein
MRRRPVVLAVLVAAGVLVGLGEVLARAAHRAKAVATE